jgi:MoxR-like ATPase
MSKKNTAKTEETPSVALVPVEPLPAAEDPVSAVARPLAAVAALVAWLKARFLEREEVIDAIVAALVAREHVLLLGEPGTAKSELAEAFAAALVGRYFYTLCTRFQTPDEVFGPLSLKALQEDRLVRATANRLPEADVAVFDEVFKGSSALLNSLLRAINEREYEQDGKRVKLPLRLIVAASNELPDESDGLGAFHDRFLLRFEVKRLQDDGNASAVIFGDLDDVKPPPVPPSDIDRLSIAADDVEVSKDAREAVLKIRRALHEKGVRVSDRRWRKAAKLLRCAALIAGRDRVTSASLGILEHCLWERTEQIGVVREVVRAHVATWIKATREAHSALDEQIARIVEAGRKGGKRHEAIAALAKCLDVLVDIDTTMEDLLKQHPEAEEEVAKVGKRIDKAKQDVNAAMRVHGIGA